MKLPILILCLAVFIPAFAEETQKVVERKTCEQIKTEIADLSAIENLTDLQQQELNQLKMQQRTVCAIKGSGRRTAARPVATPTVKSDALTEYLNNKKTNCDKLNDEIAKLEPDTNNVDIMQEMKRVYDMDCVEKPVMAPPAPENSAPTAPVLTDAEMEANWAAGLCGDGTKPNRFGCCSGETFKDMGNASFACCPKTGGDCFPPLK